jgi:DNA (cytosine-5)-methyltransferase 1
MGYSRAGFEVVGVDIKPQPRYPFEFVQADALDLLSQWSDDGKFFSAEFGEDRVGDLVGGAAVGIRGFDVQVDEDRARHAAPLVGVAFDSTKPALEVKDFAAIHASPPCQAFTDLKTMWNAGEHEDLLTPTRELLIELSLPYVIENVPGAPMVSPVQICGSSTVLGTATHEIRRHRLFETNWPLLVPPCAHSGRPTLGIYGDHARDRRRATSVENGQFRAAEGLAMAREAFEMPWANWRELSQAIPPAYTELIGHQLMQHLAQTRSAA